MKIFSTAIALYRCYYSTTTQASNKSRSWFWKKKKQQNGTTTTSPKRARIKWTDQQSLALKAVTNGQSVFITGSAGTGKTFLLKHIIKKLKKMYGRSRVFVTASTGVAACALDGQTLHSFAGVKLGEVNRDTLLHWVISDRRACSRWNKAKALIIDEISMVDAEFFENLEFIAREVRHEQNGCRTIIWGGIQLVVSGDFFQLPPVSIQKKEMEKEFAFEADCWNESFDMQVELARIFRQSDAQLIKLLQGVRRGESDPEDLQLLEKRCSEVEPDSSVVRLYPRNDDVNRVNRKKLESLNSEILLYRALDSGADPWKRQLKQGIAPDELELCLGARVMLIKNVNPWDKLVNGAAGTVISFREADELDIVNDVCDHFLLPVVKFDSGKELLIYPEYWEVSEGEVVVATRKQIPLILAWALSIHKCQGMSLDSLHTDLKRAFGFGMVYVALSRVTSLDGLHLSGFSPSKIKAHPKVLQFYQSFASETDKETRDEITGKNRSTTRNLPLENRISGITRH